MRVPRIDAGFLHRFLFSLALTPTLSRRERGTSSDRLLIEGPVKSHHWQIILPNPLLFVALPTFSPQITLRIFPGNRN